MGDSLSGSGANTPTPAASQPPPHKGEGKAAAHLLFQMVANPSTSWPGLSRPSRSGEAQRFSYRDHRDEPGDDVEKWDSLCICGQCSCFVLGSGIRLGYIIAHPCPTRGALREALLGVGAGSGPAFRSTQPVAREALGSLVLVQVETPKNPACEAPSLDPSGTAPHGVRASRCWLFDRSHLPKLVQNGACLPSPLRGGAGVGVVRPGETSVMAGRVPAIHAWGTRRCKDVDPRIKSGDEDDGGGDHSGPSKAKNRVHQDKTTPCPIAAALLSLYCSTSDLRPVRARGAATLAACRAALL